MMLERIGAHGCAVVREHFDGLTFGYGANEAGSELHR